MSLIDWSNYLFNNKITSRQGSDDNGGDDNGGDDDYNEIIGTSRNDNLIGTTLADEIYGRQGNDTIQGLNGDDDLNGEQGNDRLDGGNGNDDLEGGDGNDSIIGGLGNDELDGDAGNDSIVGGVGNDDLDGGGGNDILTGFGGNLNEKDILEGDDFNVGIDTFVLADANKVFYNNDKTGGFAIIDDLQRGDKIILEGSATKYRLQANYGTDKKDVAIFTVQNDLIAVLDDSNGLVTSLNSSLFNYI